MLNFSCLFFVVLVFYMAHRRGEKAIEAEKKLKELKHEIDELVDACGRFTL